MRKAACVPYSCDPVSVTPDAMGVERVRSNSVHFARSRENGRAGVAQVEETEPPMRDAREEQIRGFGEEGDRGDDLCGGELLQDALIGARSGLTARNLGCGARRASGRGDIEGELCRGLDGQAGRR